MSGARLPSSFDGNTEFYEENRLQKFFRRLKEEPLIPLGCGLTCWALLGASRSIRAGDHHGANRMFRARIYAQGFTLVCMVAGSFYYAGDREKRKVFEGVKAEQKAREKNEAWIRELEARDREDKEEARRKGEMRRDIRRMMDEKDAFVGAGVAEANEERNADGGIGVATSVGERDAEVDTGVAKSMVEVGEERWKGGVLDAVKELLWR